MQAKRAGQLLDSEDQINGKLLRALALRAEGLAERGLGNFKVSIDLHEKAVALLAVAKHENVQALTATIVLNGE